MVNNDSYIVDSFGNYLLVYNDEIHGKSALSETITLADLSRIQISTTNNYISIVFREFHNFAI